MRNTKSLFYLLLIIVSTSCATNKVRIKEKVIFLNKQVKIPSVKIEVKNALLVFSKEDIITLLNTELKSNLSNGILENKIQIKKLLLDSTQTNTIISTNQVGAIDGLLSIVDKLMTKGKVEVFDKAGSKADKVRLKQEFLLYGSYKRYFEFLDGREIVLTSIKYGE